MTAAAPTAPASDDEFDVAERTRLAVILAKQGKKPADQIRGIQALGELDAEPAVIRSLLGADSPKVRSSAAFTLGTFADPVDREQLEVLTNDPNSAVRRSACLALGVGHHTDASDGLKAIAIDVTESMRVRSAALESLARLTVRADKESVADLVSTANGDVHTFPRNEAYRTLSLLDSPGARSRLKACALQVCSAKPNDGAAHTPAELRALSRAIGEMNPQDEESERLAIQLAKLQNTAVPQNINAGTEETTT